jgi:hypothetical protein
MLSARFGIEALVREPKVSGEQVPRKSDRTVRGSHPAVDDKQPRKALPMREERSRAARPTTSRPSVSRR